MKARITPSAPESSIQSEPPISRMRKYSTTFVTPSTRKYAESSMLSVMTPASGCVRNTTPAATDMTAMKACCHGLSPERIALKAPKALPRPTASSRQPIIVSTANDASSGIESETKPSASIIAPTT